MLVFLQRRRRRWLLCFLTVRTKIKLWSSRASIAGNEKPQNAPVITIFSLAQANRIAIKRNISTV
jgi:hypothetical protein